MSSQNDNFLMCFRQCVAPSDLLLREEAMILQHIDLLYLVVLAVVSSHCCGISFYFHELQRSAIDLAIFAVISSYDF